MPTYEYACSKCGEHLEVVQSFTDDPLKKCPACGGRLKKVFGAVGIVFKGSGFYKTDSRNASKASKVTAGSEKAAGSDKASSDNGSSAESSSTSPTTGSDKAKTDTKKDAVPSSKSSGSSASPAAAS
jgi:putative FmdB family regulatory protein